MNHTKLFAVLSLAAILGAGCPVPPPGTPELGSTKPPATLGFGKLPSIGEATGGSVPLGAPGTRSSIAPAAMPLVAADTATNKVSEASVIDRSYVPPNPPKAVPVNYDVPVTLPTWGAQDDVLRMRKAEYPASNIAALALATGLPTQALGSTPSLEGFNFSWRDGEGFQWTYDATQRMVSFWKQNDRAYTGEPGNAPPKIDEAELVRLADDFLNRKGFGGVERNPGALEQPWGGIQPLIMGDSARMPCPVYKTTEPSAVVSSIAPATVSSGGGSSGAAGTPSGNAEPAVDMKIAPGEPYPCWFPPQVTIVYDAVRNGKKIHDAGGWPFRSVNVTIDLTDKTVTGGSAWLNQDVESSKYPLISQGEAMKRLQSGGHNPIWPWYDGSTESINVKITSAELVWMRYDVWDQKGNTTYFIPALAGKGEVTYAKNNVQPYTTIVPLVTDDAFAPLKPIDPIVRPLPLEKPMPVDLPPEADLRKP